MFFFSPRGSAGVATPTITQIYIGELQTHPNLHLPLRAVPLGIFWVVAGGANVGGFVHGWRLQTRVRAFNSMCACFDSSRCVVRGGDAKCGRAWSSLYEHCFQTLFAIPSGSYRAQKPPKAGNTKNIRKKLQSPPPWVGPRKYEKITEKIQNGHFRAIFVFFSVISSYFRGPTQGGGFCNFFVFFSYFRPWGVFVPCTSPTELQDSFWIQIWRLLTSNERAPIWLPKGPHSTENIVTHGIDTLSIF